MPGMKASSPRSGIVTRTMPAASSRGPAGRGRWGTSCRPRFEVIMPEQTTADGRTPVSPVTRASRSATAARIAVGAP
jgi:hypothetical protein